ncbi:MAG TPA: response regulator [Polyangiaceae bacterium]
MSGVRAVSGSDSPEWDAPAPPARRPTERGSASARLLVVEDNPSDVALVRECLFEPGSNYEIVNVSRLSEAKNLLHSERFDAILLDLRLPDGEELEALGVIQHAAPETPIVVVTGLEDRALARRCIEAGADDYIEKTAMTTSLLRRAVGYALARGKTKELNQRHSDRLAAIGRLSVSVAHEINNPITFITMNQELLLRRLQTLREIGGAGEAEAFGPLLATVAEMQEMLLENKVGVERIASIVRDLRPFFSTKASGEGTGLGLSVSADIIASFGGTITVDSTENEGSRFEVVLPIRDDARAEPTPPRTTRPPPVHARRRVLLVDDDAQVLVAVQRSLQSTHDVTAASGGAEALAILERGAEFDVVLCDLTMPDVDGVAVYAAVVSRFPNLVPRFVAITGGAVTDRARRFVDSGEARVVEKPVSPASLLRLIEEVTQLRPQ